jgi:formylglycine-generating enzyme required for sulfatase activity/tRNA A-37 threonylcarbamoyl transferase component Bud32
MRPGEIVDRYIVEALLGEGGMARVYRVRHQALGSLHALKVLHPHLLAHDELRGRFLAEGRIQARLRHPHLVAVTDIISQPGLAGLVMELLEGGDLEHVLQQGPVPLSVARQWTLQALSALSFVHGHGIVHRDIKPANLFIERCPDGERRLRVMDFGIARDTAAARTAVTTQMGTVGYMSPEQIRWPKSVDARSDLFSLGCVLYELLTGTAPFAADSAFSTQERITAGRFPDPVGVPAAEAAILRRALAVDREERFPTAAAFAQALTPPEPEQRRAGMALVAAALVGLLGALLILARPPAPAEPTEVPDYPMVSVAPGTFRLGPDIEVTLTRPFAIGTAEVSQALYRALMYDNPSARVGGTLPVERVTWAEAVLLANALSEHHGLPPCYRISGAVGWPDGLDCAGYRLPTEAEWAVAASASRDAPSTWGLTDMDGGVGEWCWDRHGRVQSGGLDPLGALTGRYRVVRGGSWRQTSRSGERDRLPSSRRQRGVGLRLARTLAVEG